MVIKIKRIYDPPESDDGKRILVERLWPRGVKKEKARIDIWMREIAPSHGLRKWFSHDPRKWEDFKRRYWEEIKDREELRELARMAREGNITLIYSARSEYNNAIALKQFLENMMIKNG